MVRSAISFDEGIEEESLRLAVVVRVLVHDTTRSSALLTQLKMMNGILFYDSASSYDQSNLITSNCLTMIKFSKQEAEYVAPLERLSSSRSNEKRVGFERWWRRSTVYKDSKGNEFNRKDLVLAVAEQDGGAHVDPTLNAAYADLSRRNSLAWNLKINDEDKDFENNPVPPSIRQIAHEVLKTLSNTADQIFPKNDEIFDCFSEYKEHCERLSL